MGFLGTFTRFRSKRLAGGIEISFSLKCTNLIFGETVDIALYPSDGSHPWYFRDQKFKAGQTCDFNFDTVNWQWFQGDYAAIIDKKGKIKQTWVLSLKEYAPGECPDCHGTKICKTCQGKGNIYPPGQIWNFKTCPSCGGTGICQTCEIPRRKPSFGGGPTGLKPY